MARLKVQDLVKSFGETRALGGVFLEAAAGEIHAVLGENGAGKSTLMKILAGALQADSGAMLLDEKPFAPAGPARAKHSGVAIVYQELMLCPELSVAENILLGREPMRGPFLARRSAQLQAERALARLWPSEACPISPSTKVGALSMAEQQLVEIARALALPKCRLLILDEPTSSLNRQGVLRLFGALRALAKSGMTVLYISHFLDEVMEIAQRFTVLRDGRSVAQGVVRDTSPRELATAMAGRSVDTAFVRSPRTPGAALLEVTNLGGRSEPKSVSFSLCRGEVLGIAGLLGSGRTQLLRCLFGLDALAQGQVRLGAYAGPASPRRRWRQGMGMLSEDRKAEGLALSLSVAQNLTLTKLSGLGRGGLISPAREAQAARTWIGKLSIRAESPAQLASQLSGGNQQKLALGRLLYHEADVLLLDEPTRGVDVRSRTEIYRIIDSLALAGKAILMVSSYFPELLGTCDRIAVMRRGELCPARPAAELTEAGLIAEAMGA